MHVHDIWVPFYPSTPQQQSDALYLFALLERDATDNLRDAKYARCACSTIQAFQIS